MGGFPLDQQALEFMQASYKDIATGLSTLTGGNVILSGCVVTGGAVTTGWIVWNGELLPFMGGAATGYFKITEMATSVRFEDTQERQVYFTRYAECSSTGENFARLTRLNSLLEIQNNLILQKDELVGLIDKTKNTLAELKKHYETNVITCYYDLHLEERMSSVSSPLFTPKGGYYNSEMDEDTFGRKYGAMDNYIIIRCENPDYTCEQLEWTLKPYATYNNYRDQIQLYARRINGYTGEIKTRLWYVLVHKNFTTPLLGNSGAPVPD